MMLKINLKDTYIFCRNCDDSNPYNSLNNNKGSGRERDSVLDIKNQVFMKKENPNGVKYQTG